MHLIHTQRNGTHRFWEEHSTLLSFIFIHFFDFVYQFIEEATGITGIVGHGLGSNTNEVSIIRFSFPELFDSDICFVDTPGFNHTDLPDFEVLGMIADYLNKTYVMIND